MPYTPRGDNRDRDQRSSIRDEEHGYQDPRDQRERESWRTDDRRDQRFDDRNDDRFGDQFAERDRSRFEHRSYDRGDRYRPSNDMYGNYANRSSEFDRTRGPGESNRGGYRDQDSFQRDRGDRGIGRSFNYQDEGVYGQRGYSGQGGYSGGYSGQGGYSGGYSGSGQGGYSGGYSGSGQGGYSGGYSGSGQGGTYSGQGGQSGSQAGDFSSRSRGMHHGKGPSGFQRSDERIKEMVCEALTDHDDIDATNIDVSVKSGEVTLTGTVDDRRMKRLAEECVENVRGVNDVQNQLRVDAERKTGSSRATGTTPSSSTDKSDQTDKKHRPS
jgi:osmotically-inducible protein OsmY